MSESTRVLLLGAAFAALIHAVPASSADDVAARLATASAERGELAFQTCGACHTVEKGGPTRVGPNLWDVVGRPIASRPGYDYSPALSALDGDWTFERLDAFLRAPMELVPGTRMLYPGVSDPAVRASIIEWLRTRSDSPLPRPVASAASNAAAEPAPIRSAPTGRTARGELTGFICQACHSLAIVKQQGLPRRRWDELLDWMVEEQGMDPLEPAQRDLVLDYLSAHFGIEN